MTLELSQSEDLIPGTPYIVLRTSSCVQAKLNNDGWNTMSGQLQKRQGPGARMD